MDTSDVDCNSCLRKHKREYADLMLEKEVGRSIENNGYDSSNKLKNSTKSRNIAMPHGVDQQTDTEHT